MRLTTPRLLLCFSLLLAFSQAAATESRHMGPNGGGACPESSTNDGERVDETDEAGNTPTRRTTTTPKGKPAPRASGGGGSGGRSTPPRWHSFLPGMIR